MEGEHEGGCLCGDVRYAARGETLRSCICYCASCTRTSGGIAVAWVGFEKMQFRVIKGSLAIFESTPGIWRGFCGRCGTSLTYQKDPRVISGARDHLYIVTRTFDDPGLFPPEEHVYYGERVHWLDVNDDRPHHDGASAKYGAPA